MMNSKLTNAMALEIAIASVEREDVKAKLQKMLEQTQKRKSADRKPTKTQIENADLKLAILESMEVDKQYTITDLMGTVAELEGMSNQRVSALVRQLLLDNKVRREEIKRKAYFSLNLEV